jgi:acetyl-CoA/propionyl-CoA carboxylase biotin carboxyl carrier protein
VRVDAGVQAGAVIGPAWDSLLGKLIVTGATRAEALRRAARALAEFQVDGVATVLPFHRAVVADPAFTSAPFRVHTRWIETEFVNTIAPFPAEPFDGAGPPARETVVAEVSGKRVEVTLPAGFSLATAAAPAAVVPTPAARPARGGARGAGPAHDAVLSPMQGTIVKVAVVDGQTVAKGDLVAVLEAMKMEQPLMAHKSGVVAKLNAEIGQTIASGAALCQIRTGP